MKPRETLAARQTSSVWTARQRWLAGGLGAGIALSLGLARLKKGAPVKNALWRTSLWGTSAALILRALFNRELTDLSRLFFASLIELEKTIEIRATVEEVYEFLKDFKNYPLFMSYVEKVDVDTQGGLHWKAKGPAGIRVEWHAAVGALNPDQQIAWKSLPESRIVNAGNFTLHSLPDQRTRLRVHLSYAPPAGAIGRAVTQFLGYDPRSRFNQDLNSLKRILESKSIFKQMELKKSG